MDKKLVIQLIQYLVQELEQLEAPISTIRIVKFLYLADLNYFNKYKKSLTTINWVRYKHGPYFFELPEVINSASVNLEINEIPTEQGFVRTFSQNRPVDISNIVSFVEEQSIKHVINEWAFEDLNVLLEYVYSTDPVRKSKINNEINFLFTLKKTYKSSEVKNISVNNEVKSKINQMLQDRKLSKRSSINDFYDEYYFLAIEKLNNDEGRMADNIHNIIIDQNGIDNLANLEE